MKIKEITSDSSDVQSVIDGFLALLLNQEASISKATLNEIIASDSSHLFFAYDHNDNCMGMFTVGVYLSPTGKKAWIEDVVVSENYRGQGIGKRMMDFAIQFVKDQQVKLLSLTSRPFRDAANKLYIKLGFEKKATNVYIMTF